MITVRQFIAHCSMIIIQINSVKLHFQMLYSNSRKEYLYLLLTAAYSRFFYGHTAGKMPSVTINTVALFDEVTGLKVALKGGSFEEWLRSHWSRDRACCPLQMEWLTTNLANYHLLSCAYLLHGAFGCTLQTLESTIMYSKAHRRWLEFHDAFKCLFSS